MVLKKYIIKRYFYYLLLINVSVTFLFNFIEFFEKVARVKDASLKLILQFIALNIVPSFFDSVNISCWLATIMLLKELFEQNEWEIFKILNINYKKIFNIFFIAGLITAISALIGKELVSNNLQNISNKFKFKNFKKVNFEIITNKWFEIKPQNSDDKMFCYVPYFYTKTKSGNNLLIIKMSDNFGIKKITSAKKFKVGRDKNKIELRECNITYSVKNENKEKSEEIFNVKEESKIINMPGFTSRLKAKKQALSIKSLLKNIFIQRKYLPHNIWLELLYEFIKKILLFLQIILYPILTLSLFIFFENKKIYQWSAVFAPFPIMMLSDLIVNFLIKLHINPIFIISPYVLIVLLILLIRKMIEKKYL